jgi:hypothetical protein
MKNNHKRKRLINLKSHIKRVRYIGEVMIGKFEDPAVIEKGLALLDLADEIQKEVEWITFVSKFKDKKSKFEIEIQEEE